MNYTDRMKWSEGMFLAAFAFGLRESSYPALLTAFVILAFNLRWHSFRSARQLFWPIISLAIAESLFLCMLNEHSVFLHLFFFLHTVSVLLWKTSSCKEIEPVVVQELCCFAMMVGLAFILPEDILTAANGRSYVISLLVILIIPLLYLFFARKMYGRRGMKLLILYNKIRMHIENDAVIGKVVCKRCRKSF